MAGVAANLAGSLAAFGWGLVRLLGLSPSLMRGAAWRLGWEARERLILGDEEWGLVGAVDILWTPQGPIPVVEEVAASGSPPPEPSDSTLMRIGAALILCDADPQIGRAPAEGRIRYVSASGRPVPESELRIWNTALLRGYVFDRIVAMRRHLGSERPPARPRSCPGCAMSPQCGVSPAGPLAGG